MRTDPYDQEPTPDELGAIEREWPLIDAELALLDAEIRCLSANGGPSPLDWHRVRRAEARVMRELIKYAFAPVVTAQKGAAA